MALPEYALLKENDLVSSNVKDCVVDMVCDNDRETVDSRVMVEVAVLVWELADIVTSFVNVPVLVCVLSVLSDCERVFWNVKVGVREPRILRL